MARFDGEVALVTGAAGDGIGQATAERLAQDGARVVLTDNHEGRLQKATAALAAQYGDDRIIGVSLDASDRASIDAGLQEVAERLGPVEILINNAGVVADVRQKDYRTFNTLDGLSPESWDYIMALDVSGPWYLIRGVLPGMRELGRGSIVNVSTITAFRPYPGEGAYSTAKGGLLSLTRAVAFENASQGIRCNAVAPAHVQTDFVRRNTELFKEDLARTPLGAKLGRFALPEEVASVIAFLASSEASWVTGETVVIGGGFYI